jgi:hypothetical protein
LYRVVILAQAQVSPHHLVIGSDVLPAMSLQCWGPTLVKLAAIGLFIVFCWVGAGAHLDPWLKDYCIWRWTLGSYLFQQRQQNDLEAHVQLRQPEPLYEVRSIEFAAMLGRRKASDV